MDGRESPISSKSVTLLGSGAILTEVVKAAELLAAEGVEVTVLSVTSWSELARDGVACEQRAFEWRDRARHALATRNNWQAPPGGDRRHRLRARAVPETVRAFVPERPPLHHPGHGRVLAAATRAALRQFFGGGCRPWRRRRGFALGCSQNGCWRLMDKRQQLLTYSIHAAQPKALRAIAGALACGPMAFSRVIASRRKNASSTGTRLANSCANRARFTK